MEKEERFLIMETFTLTGIRQENKPTQVSIEVDKYPDHCPCCHKGIKSIHYLGFLHHNKYPQSSNNEVQAIFQCPLDKCRRFFIADYVQDMESDRARMADYGLPFELQSLSPYWGKEENFPEVIQRVSPSFCQIFNEASTAEHYRLKNVAGPGYRKALEFLVKDFLISEEPAKKEAIQSMNLQNAIQNKVRDTNVKTCAERATWLGNDETHYLRKWDDKDIEDLKKLIRLTAAWIENDLLTKDFLKAMPPLKKS